MIHETPEQRAAEKAIAERVCRAWDCEGQKTPGRYVVDWVLERRDGRQAWMECKDRSKYGFAFYEAHGGFVFPAMKWAEGHLLAWATDRPFVLVMLVKEGSLWTYTAADRSHDGLLPKGIRNDRDDPNDKQPHILLRTSRFRPVSEPAP